jgi:seryl-tRNA synthetase
LAITEAESLAANRKNLSETFGRLKREGNDTGQLTAQLNVLKAKVEQLEALAEDADAKLRTLLQSLPNLPQDSVPIGPDECSNRIEKVWDDGEKLTADGSPDTAYTPAAPAFPAQPHWEIGERLGILDFERAAKISGSRFVVHFGQGARLERALANFMLDLHTREHGYTEVLPPYMVNSNSPRTSSTATTRERLSRASFRMATTG